MNVDTLTLIRPDDWHLHLRDGPLLATTVADTARRFGRAIVMPNLRPPVTSWVAAQAYRKRILAHVPAGFAFEPLMTLYLTDRTELGEIQRAREKGIVAAKLYPAGATTNSDSGVSSIDAIHPILEAMESCGLPLLIHGEVTDAAIDIFDRERTFIDRILEPLVRRYRDLRIVLEHITTQAAVDFVRAAPRTVAATITPHHLLLNRNDLLAGGVRPHHYCLPVLKRESDREALLEAATSGDPRFFSAPTAHRTSAGAKKQPAAAPASTARMPASNSTRKPSTRPAHSTGWKASPPASARISTACHATANASPCDGKPGKYRPTTPMATASSSPCGQAARSPGSYRGRTTPTRCRPSSIVPKGTRSAACRPHFGHQIDASSRTTSDIRDLAAHSTRHDPAASPPTPLATTRPNSG